MPSETPNIWNETRLWKYLVDRTGENDPARLTLQMSMPTIETVLAKGGTAAPDFTLHDEEHGFGVAQRMAELIPADVLKQMGSFELSLLLLSAYLHDIGMTPKRDVVQRHYRYILTAEEGLLTLKEVSDLEYWLDQEREGLELPVPEGPASATDVQLADELLAYYCRHRHNDWSEDWIREELRNIDPGLYPEWIHDLVALCRSHHEGLHDLRTGRFDAKMAGHPSQVVNLRYLAALLRVADVLEFDPERTPPVILRHRNISPESKVYWHKDQGISLTIKADKRQILLTARTPDAHIHRAVNETIDAINSELLCCDVLRNEGAFGHGTVPESERFHEWPWPARISDDVKERDNSFVYIDGAFRPDTQRVLKLLSGTNLYGSPLVAVRELIQNATDAVNEQIAWQRLAFGEAEPDDSSLGDALARPHRISLTFLDDGDACWLSCADTGAGMTKEIIEKFFLVSGASQRPDLLKLERYCRKRGFISGRTGQFGIGVLSYFMLAEYMSMTTRRSEDAGGQSDRKAWRFETGGLGEFGQLVPESTGQHGTEVRLRLRPDVIGASSDEWFEELVRYIRNDVTRVPCRFILRHHNIEKPAIDIPAAGWVRTPDYFSEILVTEFRLPPWQHSSDTLRPAVEMEKQEEADIKWRKLKVMAKQQLRYHGPIESELPARSGQFRIFLPYFDHPGGASLVFMDLTKNKGKQLPGATGNACALSGNEFHSWRGFRTGFHGDMVFGFRRLGGLYSPFIVEVDWIEGGKISVARDELNITDQDFSAARRKVQSESRKLLQSFIEQHQNSRYATLNRAFAIQEFPSDDFASPQRLRSISAPISTPLVNFTWETIKYPAIEIMRGNFSYPYAIEAVKYKDKEIYIYRSISCHGRSETLFPLGHMPGARLLLIRDVSRHIPAAMWLRPPRERNGTIRGKLFDTIFPTGWKDLTAITTGVRLMWNSENQVVQAVDEDGWKWVVSNVGAGDPRPHKNAILSARSRCAAWLLSCMDQRNEIGFWQALSDHEPSFLKEVWRMVFERESDPISCVVRFWESGREFASSTGTMELTSSGLRISKRPFDRDNPNTMKFPSGFTLEIPDDSEWVADVIFDEDKLPGRERITDGPRTKGRKGKRAKKSE